MSIDVKFWGVRGSVPAPLDGAAVEAKIRSALAMPPGPLVFENLPFHVRSTYGGNTSCVEVKIDGHRIVLDMGTGLRALGNSLFPEMFKSGGLNIHFLLSHVHWDHIQGIPFFGPLYVNKATGICNAWHFYGGTGWQKDVETVLSGQMDAPTFPISWSEIQDITQFMETFSLHDMKRFGIGNAMVTARKLNHPQETYGWRIECDGKVMAYTTDNEPYDPVRPDPRLLSLCRNADLWITDCQYTKDIYEGGKGVPRHGWGHSYPEAVAATALLANVKQTVLFHHDPASSDEQISAIERHCQSLAGGNFIVKAAYEGMEISI